MSNDDCHKCKNKLDIPGNTHIGCSNPDEEMTGDPNGIENGWFFYPFCFDPRWKTKKCVNFEEV